MNQQRHDFTISYFLILVSLCVKKMKILIWNVVLFLEVLYAAQSLAHKGCGDKPADVFFVIDSSGSIKYEDFQKQLQFVKNLVKMFDIGPDKTRVGLISFSTSVVPEFGLGEFTDQRDIIRRIGKVQYQAGGTNTGEALNFLRHKAFGRDPRPNVAHVAIVLTDGKSSDMQRTLHEADKAHQEGIVVFAIGIGNEVRKKELKAIASDPPEKYMYEIDKFEALDSIKDELAEKTCEVPPATVSSTMISDMDILYGGKECAPDAPLEMEFAFDAAGIGLDNTKFVLMFIASIADRVDKRQNPLLAGVISSQCSANNFGNLTFGSGNDRESVKHMMTATKTTPVATLLRGMRINLKKSNETKKVGLLFISGSLPERDYFRATREIRRAVFQNIGVYVIGVGERVNVSQAISLTTGFNQFFHTKLYETLDELVGQVLLSLCRLRY